MPEDAMSSVSSLVHLKSVSSTNLELKRLQHEHELENGTILIADYQTDGRGRNDHTWESKPGDNLLFSTWIHLNTDFSNLAGYSLLPSLAVADVLQDLGAVALCKWPNDIRIDGEKICGILIECVSSSSKVVKGAIIGIGININSCPDDIGEYSRSTCLNRHIGSIPDFEHIAVCINRAVMAYSEKWLSGKQADVIALWKQRCDHMGLPVYVSRNGEKILGITKDVTDTGNLLVQIGNELVELSSEEVLCRGSGQS